MHKIFISITLALSAAACSTQAAKTASEPAPVSNAAMASKGMKSDAPQPIDPLTDPTSPLSQRNVYFDFDSSEISGDGLLLLQAHARYLMEHAATKIELQGNTDERGSREYNVSLGERRAVVVKRDLVAEGVKDDRIAVVSYGKEKPVANCHEESCWKQNRRVFIKY